MSDLRIPFDEAISEPRLLRSRWEELSLAQQTVLRSIYGLPISAAQRRPNDPWSGLDYWAASQGFADFDSLGYITRVHHDLAPAYRAEEFSEGWLNEGVRSGKSSMASFIVTYEAVCGGHEQFLRPGRRAYCFQVAQDLRQAKYALHDIVANLESIPFLRTPVKATGAPRMGKPTADRVDLWNGMTVMTTPPTVKSVRGYDSPVAVMDEVAVWYQDADSANPDFEVYRQLKSRQAQFDAKAVKLIGLSSPWNKGGLLWQRCKAGTRGMLLACDAHVTEGPNGACPDCKKAQRPHRRHFVATMPTAAMGNPLVSRAWLQEQQETDPRAYRRECLAEFLDSVSGFLDPDLLHSCVSKGVVLRPPTEGHYYVAAIDPAFRRDSFAFAIAHVEVGGRVVYDYLKRWEREPGQPPLNPELLLRQVVEIAQTYHIHTLFSDQFEINAMKILAGQLGMAINEISFQAGSKAEIYANLQSLLNQRKLSLLDHEDGLNELLSLERTLTQGGMIAIAAPNGQKDDLATVMAICAQQAVWLPPSAKAVEVDPEPFEDVHARINRQIEESWTIREENEWVL